MDGGTGGRRRDVEKINGSYLLLATYSYILWKIEKLRIPVPVHLQEINERKANAKSKESGERRNERRRRDATRVRKNRLAKERERDRE